MSSLFIAIFFKMEIHTLIVYSLLIFPKFKYTIEIPASKVHLTPKIHTLIVYPPEFRAFREWKNIRKERKNVHFLWCTYLAPISQ